MIKPKSALLQIRIEPELMERFQRMSNDYEQKVSPMLRAVIEHACGNHEARMRKREIARQQKNARARG